MKQADDQEQEGAVATRREFCARTCQALSVLAMGAIMPACGGSSTSPSSAPQLSTVSGTVGGGTMTINVDAASPLATVGSAALAQGAGVSLLIARTAQETFTALTAICTHESCVVSGRDNQTYVCPCHGSEYSTTGSVVKGPASAPLRQFTTRFANSVLTITL